METKSQAGKEAALTVVKKLKAPIESVFEAFSNPVELAEWWGPAEYIMTVTEFNFKPQGICLFKMENEHGIMWARFIYREIETPYLLEFVLSFSNENGGIARAPFFENWPLEILNVITLAEENTETTLTINCYPVNATDEEITSFRQNKLSLNQGLSAAITKLEARILNKA